MALDFGKSVIGGYSPAEGAPPTQLPDGIQHYYCEKKSTHPKYADCDIRIYDKNIQNIQDNTKIDGYFQDEQYIVHRRDEIKNWLKVKPEYNFTEYSSDDICILNFRGGEFCGLRETFLPQIYWKNAMKHMLEINSNFKFIVITDDVFSAKSFFPNLEVYHFSIGKDYSIINNAKYLILSNSSFAWFPAWTNDNLKFCIAPKYWGKHNVSDGFWNLGYTITSGWNYQNREGILESYEQCLKQSQEYINNHQQFYR